MKKSKLLRNLISQDKLDFIMEAHNGLSARIVEEAGFAGIWASGLSISASLGVRDSNELSWSQVVDVLEYMSDVTSIPILLDGDTGHGNFNNVRRLIAKLEQRQIAGVCIEDKLFPKTNSFIRGETQPLADVHEFCGKIKAAKDNQRDEDFVVVARVEALIAGWGLSEALIRADAYRAAGADAILIHSKRTDASEIEAFMNEWANRHPVVLVPTKYYATPTERFREMGVSLLIWANHTIRSAIAAMQRTTRRIFQDQHLRNVEGGIASVEEIFRLQAADELLAAEKRYLPTHGKNVNAIVLAASQGNLGPLTQDLPKTLLSVQGKTILDHQLDGFRQLGIRDIAVVRGFGKDRFAHDSVSYIDNAAFASTSEVHSLFLALEHVREETIISYGDLIYRPYLLNELLGDENDITLVVDADCVRDDNYHEFVTTQVPYSRHLYAKSVQLSAIFGTAPADRRTAPSLPASGQIAQRSGDLPPDNSHRPTDDGSQSSRVDGEFIGLFRVKGQGSQVLRNVLRRLAPTPSFEKLRMKDLLTEVLKEFPIAVRFIKGSWLDINTIVDLQKAGDF